MKTPSFCTSRVLLPIFLLAAACGKKNAIIVGREGEVPAVATVIPRATTAAGKEAKACPTVSPTAASSPTAAPTSCPSLPPDRGTFDLQSAFPGAGVVSGVTNAPGASLLCVGARLLGVDGTAVCQGLAGGTVAATADVMAGKFYWNASGVSVQGTLPNNGTWNLAAGNNPAGVYDGSVTNAPAASAVCSLTTVNGVAGTAVCQGLAGGTVASTADVMAGKFYWNASGVSVQGTLPNNGTWNLAAGSNPAGVYDGSVTNAPAASAVCSLTTVNGVPGTAICDVGGHLNSTLARTKGTAIISQKEEIAAGSLPSGYREIPNVALDSDGHGGSEVTKASRPTTACGMTQATLDARIADCVTRNAGNATWNGATHGIGGEGTWSLVTAFLPAGANGDPCAGLCEEVWRDNRTGLVWSDWLGSASNTRSTWCPASGNVENVGVNCLPGAGQQPNPAQSWCAESAGLTTPSTYDPEKGGMRATATGTSPSVRWRLPTRRDFMMADLNGLRFVVPHSTSYYWTSTLYSGNDDRAWRFEGDYGQVFYDAQLYGGDGVIADDRTSSQSRVRCVGR